MPPPDDVDLAAARLFGGLLRRAHLCAPSELATVVAEEASAALGARSVVTYLVDHDEEHLVPVPADGSPDRSRQPVEASMAGRAYTSAAILTGEPEPGDGAAPSGWRRVWVPLLDGTDRLGVLEMTLPTADGRVSTAVLAACERYGHLTAQTVVAKDAYGDVFELVRRTRPMSVGAELLRSMLPPLTYATTGLVVSAVLEPTYDSGGDAFDYALDDGLLHLAVFDGMGHGLAAAGLTTFALAAYRNSRRRGLSLERTYAEIDRAVLQHFGGERHVTAVLAELDVAGGRLRWVNAGHPPPLLLREASVVKALHARPTYPMGWPFHADAGAAAASVTVGQEDLQPGDMALLYTDGLVEARGQDGAFLGTAGLAEFLEQQAASGQPAPETLRRLRQAVRERQREQWQDDATALLVEWRRGSEQRLLPLTLETGVDAPGDVERS
ncbi:PP2C family protein-serine/threonine phosphatase [Kineococcus sp. SYSU DK004]|uniref:PP2C family protein-serine/threonine phosphatase n=1 Tax=Kineococcus sp. SYSU DK004 TaxID=3383125 RepID=UPI003D7C6200